MPISKKEAVEACIQVLDDRIAQARLDLKKTQDSANNETKSSMGDKYETGRAMAQNEKQKLQVSLVNMLQQKKAINQVKFSDTEEIRFGSLVQTDSQTFFISTALGEVSNGSETFYAMSPISPMAQALSGEKDEVKFNGKNIKIVSVEN